jgi:type I restriction enzyme R subunit
MILTKSTIEAAALEWLVGLGYEVLHGAQIAPWGPTAERASFSDVVLAGQLRDTLARFNPRFPSEALNDAFHKLTCSKKPTLEASERAEYQGVFLT